MNDLIQEKYQVPFYVYAFDRSSTASAMNSRKNYLMLNKRKAMDLSNERN